MDPEYPRFDTPAAPPPPESPPPPATARTARTPVLLLAALLTELVVIGGVDNTWVADKIFKVPVESGGLDSMFKLHLRESLVVFRWRFSPGAGDHQHIWLSEILAIVAVLVISLLLIAAVVRGAITFWRALFGTWTAVIVATLVAAAVRAAVVDEQLEAHSSRLDRAVFFGPNALWVVAGVLLGFIVAVVVAVLAVTTRRRPAAVYDANTPMPDPYTQAQSPFFAGTPSGFAAAGPPARPWPDPVYAPPPPVARPGGDEPTTQLPNVAPARDEPTTQVPRMPAGGDEPTTQVPRMPAGGDEPTTQVPNVAPASDEHATHRFPRPPDDEDLGHLETEA